MSSSEIEFADTLERAIATFRERNAVYKDGWIRHGEIMKAFFPDGLELKTAEDFSRFMLFEMCVSKLNRYSANLKKGGHPDSVHDCGIYSLILEMYDNQMKGKKK